MKQVVLPIIDPKRPSWYKNLWILVFISVVFHLVFAISGGYEKINDLTKWILVVTLLATLVLGSFLSLTKEYQIIGQVTIDENGVQAHVHNNQQVNLTAEKIKDIRFKFMEYQGMVNKYNPPGWLLADKGTGNYLYINTKDKTEYKLEIFLTLSTKKAIDIILEELHKNINK